MRSRRGNGVPVAVAALAGALFGTGLLLSGMTRPARVIGFLDVASGWDPTLAFVMAGAVLVYGIAYRAIRARVGAPWFDRSFHVSSRTEIDWKLVLGAAVFGIGWGLAGYCPGPAIVAAGSGASHVLLFIAAMAAGMALQRLGRAR